LTDVEQHRPPIPGPPTRADRDAAQLLEELSSKELTDVRSAATNWRTGLLALLGLVTTVLVVKGRDSFAELPQEAQILIGASLLLALLLAARGSLQAMRAAYGDPSVRRTDSGVLEWDHDDAVAAVESLRSARLEFAASLAFLVIAIGLTWYWPAAPQSLVRADFGAVKICGSLISADASTIVIKEDGSAKSNPIAGLSSLAVVSSCP
jgi:hypothetical protein